MLYPAKYCYIEVLRYLNANSSLDAVYWLMDWQYAGISIELIPHKGGLPQHHEVQVRTRSLSD